MTSSDIIIALIVALYLLLMVGIGYAYRRSAGTTAGFLTADRTIGTVVGGLALAVTYMSTATLLGTVSLAYRSGVAWALFGGVAVVLGFFVCMFVLGPRLRQSNTSTISEFFGKRYGTKSRQVSAALIAIILFFYLIAQVQGGALVVQGLFETSYENGVLIIGGVFIAYMALGGMRAATMTSFLQAILLFFGVVAVTVSLFMTMSWSEIMEGLSDVRPNYFTSAGSVGIGYGITFGILIFVSLLSAPHVLFRFFASTDARIARRTAGTSALVSGLFYACLVFPAIAAILLVGSLQNPDQAYIAAAEATIGNPILLGVIFSGVLAAAMSTADAMLLVATSALIYDIGHKWIPAHRAPLLLRIATLVLGAGVVGITLSPPGLILEIVVLALSMLAGGFFVPVMLGLFTRIGSDTAGYVSMLTGVAVTVVTHPATPGIRLPEQTYAGLVGIGCSLAAYYLTYRLTSTIGSGDRPGPRSSLKE